MTKRFVAPAIASALLFPAACKSRDFNAASTKDTSGESTGVKHDTRGSCVIPVDGDFKEQAANPKQESTIALSVKEVSAVSGGVPFFEPVRGERLGNWIVRAVTPLNMNCDTYRKDGLTRYGAETFASFAKLVATAYAVEGPAAFTPVEDGFFDFREVNEEKDFPMLGILRRINALIVEKDVVHFRAGGEDSMHSIPLRDDELAAMQEISKEGLLSVRHYDEPFKNAYGEMVKGDFLAYPDGDKVDGHLLAMHAKYVGLSKAPEPAYVDGVAGVVRDCIAIHPFHNGNGRSCLLLGVWALGRRGIPHAVIWAGEDVLLKKEEWTSRFRQGVEAHKAILAAP